MIDIKRIINEKSIKIYFQVILSPMETQSISIESFVRGVDPDTHEIISPLDLFQAAKNQNLGTELDSLCIQMSFKNFKAILDENPNVMLYINMDFDYFEPALGKNLISNFAKDYGISRRRVVLDLSNLDVKSPQLDLIQSFIDYHRKKGFYISIDDIGKDYSNIDRIILFNPDIIKINHQMFNTLYDTNYKTLMMDYIIHIAHKMGILVISTGVETQEDIVASMASGAQMIQGYYVSKIAEYDYPSIETIINDFDRSSVFSIIDAQYQGSEREAIASVVRYISRLRMHLKECLLSDLDVFATETLEKSPFIESGYLLNPEGMQISRVYINKKNFGNRNIELFDLYNKGTDHTYNESFSRLQGSILTDWVTRPFRSKLTNEVCITASFKIKTKDAANLIIVMNIDFVEFSRSESSHV